MEPAAQCILRRARGRQQSNRNQLDSGLLSRLAQGHQRNDGAPACAGAYMREYVLFIPPVTRSTPTSCAIHGGASRASVRRRLRSHRSQGSRMRTAARPLPSRPELTGVPGKATDSGRHLPGNDRSANAQRDSKTPRASRGSQRRYCGAGTTPSPSAAAACHGQRGS